MVPFHSYAGVNSGIPIDALSDPSCRQQANTLFGFNGSERLARTIPGWLESTKVESLIAFCDSVANAYAEAPSGDPGQGVEAS